MWDDVMSSVVELSDQDRLILESWSRSSSVSAGHVERARIVLSVAAGAGTTQAAKLVGVSRPTVIKWRDRFVAEGIAGLDDERRSGRPKMVDDAGILAATLEQPRNAWR
jgi:transposase